MLTVARYGLVFLLAPEAGPLVLGLQLRVGTVIARTKVRTRVGEVVDGDAIGRNSRDDQALRENLPREYKMLQGASRGAPFQPAEAGPSLEPISANMHSPSDSRPLFGGSESSCGRTARRAPRMRGAVMWAAERLSGA
jgi:hypothetical protein